MVLKGRGVQLMTRQGLFRVMRFQGGGGRIDLEWRRLAHASTHTCMFACLLADL